ncbi:MAG: DUF5666 domain-containing protein [Mycobacterium sp.]|nr:DUF5666 domain-containing protein [Mycobacterium sp.]
MADGAAASPRRTRLALAVLAILVGLALATAMCGRPDRAADNPDTGKLPAVGSSPRSAPGAPAPPSAAPAPPEATGHVEGLVESISENEILLRTRSGSARVDVSPSTRVVEVTPAALSDVTPGRCVNVRAAPPSAPDAGITAQAVTITAAVDGKCPPPAGFYGTVAAVSGTTIAVNGLGSGNRRTQTNVTVDDKTSYNKQTATDADAIEQGRCLAAQGTDGGGVLQATLISLQECPPMGGQHHHHHLHLPHLHLHL